MPIPESLLVDLAAAPRDRPISLLMRHSNRFPITDPARNYEIGLTEEGVQLAVDLGSWMAARFSLGRLHSSPVGRCVDTANAIARGAGWARRAVPHVYLSHDHIEPAWNCFSAGQVNGRLPSEVTTTLGFLLDHGGDGPVLDIHVTHDTVLGTLVGCLLRQPVLDEHWPAFLEGALFWKDQGEVCAVWRGQAYRIG